MLRFALIVLLGAVGLCGAFAQAPKWNAGRATYYGTDGWSIHSGSCAYGQLSEDVGTGWDIAALHDVAADYKGSCGKCKEVRCKATNFKDGYGAVLERAGVCYDPTASTVVMIVDTCPCVYPGNMYSNKRWCCGDMYHMDLSLWAFEKLADIKWGVIALEWRDVACDYRPTKQAANPFGRKTPMPEWYKPRPGWSRWMDKRVAFLGDSYRGRRKA
ncbi:MAG: RlpA-like double-psi beta-barrel-protein domain-containing protein-containing protein [Monoraphidium minutum]|nr:MAG: RlpA-like double-psi beta-barrel-protein domain-containing protein-containing protein [Monoraphidium minutum]